MSITGKLKKKALRAFEDANVAGRVASGARAKYLDRWMERTAEITGEPCTDPDKILYDDPQISLEWKICDPRNLRMIMSGRGDEFAATLTDAERDLWYNYVDEDGERYSDLAKRSVARDTLAGLNPLKKRKKK